MSSDPLFVHRLNENGTFDSICMKCYRIVDTQLRKVDLAGARQTMNSPFAGR
jgi:hypothetical protein